MVGFLSKCIRSPIDSFNAASMRVPEKCGFERQGLFRENSFVRGAYVDVVPMGILRAAYSALREGRARS